MRRKARPAAHGVELLGFHGGGRRELVDRRVELRPRSSCPARGHFRTPRPTSRIAVRARTPGQASASGRCTSSYQRFQSASTEASTSAVTIEQAVRQGWSFRHSSCTRGSGTMECRQRQNSRGDGRMRKLVWLAAAAQRSPASASCASAGDAAQGRHDPHDGALCRELRQPRSAHHAARPGRHRQQGDAAHALQLGHHGQTSWCSSSPSR